MENSEPLADLSLLVLLVVLLGCFFAYDWLKLRFNGFRAKKIFCLHKKEYRDYLNYSNTGIFGSKYKKFKCKNCGRTVTTVNSVFDRNGKEEITY